MRPKGFWSAFLIYGAMSLVFLVIALYLLAHPRGTDDLIQMFGLAGVMAILFGLLMAFGFGPAKRTLPFSSAGQFVQRMKQATPSLGYRLSSESTSRLVFRKEGIRPWFADVVVELNTNSASVSGPREFLNRLTDKLAHAR